MFRPWLVLISLLSISVFYQNCGSPAGGGEQAPAPQKTQSLAVDETLAIEAASYLTLTGIDWQNMTDEEVIVEVIEQLENVIAGLPASSAPRARIQEILDLIRSSAEFRTLVVAQIREATFVPVAATPTPTPAPGVYPACSLDVNPFSVDRTVANTLTFTWTSQNGKYAAFKYWDGLTQMSSSIPLNGTHTLNLRANFSTRPDIIPFNVMVVDTRGAVGKCTIFVQFN